QALDVALSELLRRHESLRTTIQVKAMQPLQIIAQARAFLAPVVDLQGLQAEHCEAQARNLAREVAARPFDLAEGPLLRVWLLRKNVHCHVVALTMHHIISDGVSNEIFVRELSTLYTAFVGGVPVRLPELPIQYADFAVWQREWLRDEMLAQQTSYWRKQLEGIPVLDLPTDRPRPPMPSYQGKIVSRWFAP